MLENIIPLISSFVPIWENYLVYVFALGFVSFVPSMILYLFRR